MDFTILQLLDDGTTKVAIAQSAKANAVEIITYLSTTYPTITFILAPNADASQPVPYLNGQPESA
jgi:hypothetical protein